MRTTCADCGLTYDDLYRRRICPHEGFEMRCTTTSRVEGTYVELVCTTVEQQRRFLNATTIDQVLAMGGTVVGQYPPITPVEEYPLHPAETYGPEFVWACQDLGGQRGRWTVYDWRCPACIGEARRHVVDQGDHWMAWTRTAGEAPEPVLLSWLIARGDHWLAIAAGDGGTAP